MTDGRSFLPVGTRVELAQGSVYEITGTPIGLGGGSIIYPAQRLVEKNGLRQTDGFLYALKECYPVSSEHFFTRSRNGEIVPRSGSSGDRDYLLRVQLLQLEEGAVSRNIYRTASRMLPIRESSQNVVLTLPGEKPAAVGNTVTIMDNLSGKGRSLASWLKERGRFAPAEAFRILQQILMALQEVHQGGYVHLDIQSGNLFLRGTLEEKSELVTLIDFGSARPLVDGKTAPIRDKAVFTTPGFCAPEILLHNDGTLRLGPEADIYSVGCLALYLLTGVRPNSHDLLANRTGLYLKPNHLRRIACAKHLVDKMQAILGKALEKEPKNRYHSASEMLADCAELADALQPYRTDLSSVTYDAFVCYKHGPVDSAAALTIQRELENYRAPKGVCPRRKPFSRVFVDEGELSSCSDFGQQIREALKNSGWLIVVCSPDTPSSPWVQEEIKTFLEYHDRSRILAVLTGGDKTVSFPPQLEGNPGGKGEVYAPHALSSTPREAVKNLRGDTLLKIVAPMLGTTYDTLKQRQKIYRLQRLAAVTAVFLLAAMGFAAYAANRANVIAQQALRIAQEYENTLINESLYLSEQAQKRLDHSDPLGAIELALAALPSQTQERPVLTEAEYVLGKALGIYTTTSSAQDTITAVGKIETEAPYFFLDETGKYLFIWYDSYLNKGIQIWDAETLCLIRELFSEDTYALMPVWADDATVYVQKSTQVISFDYLTGSKNWVWDAEGIRFVRVSEDKTSLVVLREENAGTLELAIVSVASGECLLRHSFRINNGLYINDLCVSPDLHWAAISSIDEKSFLGLQTYSCLYLVNLQTGECRQLRDADSCISAFGFFDNQLAVMRSRGYTLTTANGKATYSYIIPSTFWLEAYDPANCELLWSNERQLYPTTTGIDAIGYAPYDDSETTGEGILFTFSDQCVLIDRETGRVVREYKLSDAVVDILYTPNGFETINTDGWSSRVDYDIDYESDTVVNIQYWEDSVTAVCRTGENLYVQSSPGFHRDYTIRKYQRNKYDDSYCAYWTAEESDWSVYACVEGKILLAKENRVCLVDSDGETWICDIPEEFSFSYYSGTVGLSDDGTRWYISRRAADDSCWIDSREYAVLDICSGEMEEIIMPQKPSEDIRTNDCIFAGEKLFFTTREPVIDDAGNWTDYEKISIFEWDFPENTLTRLHELVIHFMEEEYSWSSFRVDRQNGWLFYSLETSEYPSVLQRMIRVDLDSLDTVSIPLTFLDKQEASDFSWYKNPVLWNRDGTRVFLLCGDLLYMAGEDGKLYGSIPVKEDTEQIWLSPDETDLFHISENGILTRYRVSDGMCLGQADLRAYSAFNMNMIYSDDMAWEFPDENTLVVYTDEEGFLLDLSDETVKVKATIDHCIGYDAANDRFLTADTAYVAKEIGSIPRYTLAALIEKGNMVLGNPVQP